MESTRFDHLLQEVAWWHDCPWITLGMRIDVCGRTATIVGATTSHSTSWGVSSHQLILQGEEGPFEWEPEDRATFYDQQGKVIADFQESNMLQGRIERVEGAIGLRHAAGIVILPSRIRGFVFYHRGWVHGMLYPKYERLPVRPGAGVMYTRAGVIVNARGMLFHSECYPYQNGLLHDVHEGMQIKVSRLLLPMMGLVPPR
jgi:hypothetical protein